MVSESPALWLLEQEARALLTRLERVKPFALYETMVPAAALSQPAQIAIERFLAEGRHELRTLVETYINRIRNHNGFSFPEVEAQRRFVMLKMRFNAILTQFDIFADVITQRSEHDNGVWLAGLDVLAADTMELTGGYYQALPIACYLDRGHGAAIRRARTRLPGNGKNPVAIIRIPRERMIGNGIASSLVHEVGHQASVLLDLVDSLRPILKGMQEKGGIEQSAWVLYERWLAEILADFWSAAKLGITATMGLMSVVSLPRAFVFRINPDDPHPFPWIRVKISCAIGHVLYPHQQWNNLVKLWEALYPIVSLDEGRRRLIALLEKTMPGLVSLLVNHRPRSLRGKSLLEAMNIDERHPARLTSVFRFWRKSPALMRKAPPSLVFAVIGQAKVNGEISPEEESRVLADLLTYWALKRALGASAEYTRLTGKINAQAAIMAGKKY